MWEAKDRSWDKTSANAQLWLYQLLDQKDEQSKVRNEMRNLKQSSFAWMTLLKANKQPLGSQHLIAQINAKLMAMTKNLTLMICFKMTVYPKWDYFHMFVCRVDMYECVWKAYMQIHMRTAHTHRREGKQDWGKDSANGNLPEIAW